MRNWKYWTKKSWVHLFSEMISGNKTHDIRLNEGYGVGDYLKLREFDNTKGEYTGRSAIFIVTYVTSNKINCAYSAHLLKNEYVILSVALVPGSLAS